MVQWYRIHLSMQEMQLQSLGWEDALGRKWKPSPVSLLRESHGQRSLADYSPWGHKESDMTEHLSTHTYIVMYLLNGIRLCNIYFKIACSKKEK